MILSLLAVNNALGANQTWDGGSLLNGNWATADNWDGAVPGAVGTTTNLDIATFNAAVANSWGNTALNSIVIDANRNIGGINFDTSAGNYFIGSTGLSTLRLSSGGTIQILSGFTSTSGVETINAPLSIQGAGGSYTFANNSAGGTLNFGGTISGAVAGATVLNLSGSNTNANTIGGVISNGSATTVALTKAGTGTWVLSGANTFTGAVNINAGALRASNNTALGDAAGGGVTVASGGALELTGGITVGAKPLSISGTGVNGNGALRNVTGASTNNTYGGNITLGNVASTRINSDAGTLTLSGNLGEAAAGATTLFIGGAGAISFTGGGSSDTTLNITKDGIGSVTVTGTAFNAMSNGTLSVNRGTLNLDYSGTNTSHIQNGAPLVLGGGTINLQGLGGTHTEAVANTTVNAGASNITRSSGNAVLRMNTTNRNTGGILNFGAASIADTDRLNSGGILGAWATVGGSAYAINSTNAGNGPVTALATYNQTLTRLSSGGKVISNTAANHVQITEGTGAAGNITLSAGVTTISTLTNSAAGTTAPAGGVTIDPASQTLRTSGILNAATSSALTIGTGTNNGFLASNSAGGELILQNFSTTNPITVNSVVANNGSASSLTVAGTGTRDGTITGYYLGTTILNAANTYTGTTYISGGNLQLGNGGTTGSLATGSAIVNNGSLTFNRSNTVTQGTDFNSVISGGGNVIQAGAGTVYLTGTNTYTGVTMFDSGIVNVSGLTNYGVAGPLGNRSFADEAITDVGLYFEGGTLQYTGNTATSTDRFIRIGNGNGTSPTNGATIDASGTIPGATMSFTNTSPNVDPWAVGGARTLTLTGSNTGDNLFAINLQQHAGNTTLVKSGSGTWVMGNSHNADPVSTLYSSYGGYGGGTTVSGGTLAFVDGGIGGGVINVTGNSTLRWQPGATMDLTTGTGGGVARSLTIANNTMLTLNTNGNNVTLSGPIGGTTGAAVTKTGTGTLTLSSTANAYAGGTVINAGTLLLGASNVLPDSGMTLEGGTLATGGFSDSAGVFWLPGSSTKIIDFGSSASSILNFSNTVTTGWTGRLEIWNWSGTINTTGGTDQLTFTSYSGGSTFSPYQVQIQFYSGAGTGAIGNHGMIVNNELIPYLVPVPETRTVAGILLLAAMVGWRERRHFLRCPEAREKAREAVVA